MYFRTGAMYTYKLNAANAALTHNVTTPTFVNSLANIFGRKLSIAFGTPSLTSNKTEIATICVAVFHFKSEHGAKFWHLLFCYFVLRVGSETGIPNLFNDGVCFKMCGEFRSRLALTFYTNT